MIRGKYHIGIFMLRSGGGIPRGVYVNGHMSITFDTSDNNIRDIEEALYRNKYRKLGFSRFTLKSNETLWSITLSRDILYSDNIDNDVEKAVNEIKSKMENLISELKEDIKEAIEAIETFRNLVTELNVKYETEKEFAIVW